MDKRLNTFDGDNKTTECSSYQFNKAKESIDLLSDYLDEIEKAVYSDIERLKEIQFKINKHASSLRQERNKFFSASIKEELSFAEISKLKEINEKLLLLYEFGIEENVEDYLYIGMMYYHQENYEAALELYNKVTEICPDNLDGWANKGHIFLRMNKFEDALEAFEKANEIDPDFTEIWYSKFLAYLKLNRHESVLQILENISNDKPDDIEFLVSKGKILIEIGNYKNAINTFDKILKKDPCFNLAWYYKAICFFNAGNYDSFLVCVSNVQDELHDVDIWLNLGNLLLKIGKYENALLAINNGLSIDPVNTNLLLQKIGCLSKLLLENESKESLKEINGKEKLQTNNDKPTIEDLSIDDPKDFKETCEEELIINASQENTTEVNDEKYEDIETDILNNLKCIIESLYLLKYELSDVSSYNQLCITVHTHLKKLGNFSSTQEIIEQNVDLQYEYNIGVANNYICFIIAELKNLASNLEKNKNIPISESVSLTIKNIVDKKLLSIIEVSKPKDEVQNLLSKLEFCSLLENILSKFESDSPFPISPKFNRSILVGSQEKEFKSLLEEVKKISIINPVMTVLIGEKGSGKSHFLHNLEYECIKNKNYNLALVYKLKDKVPTIEEIIEFIYSSENFKKMIFDYDLQINPSKNNSLKDLEINNCFEQMNKLSENSFSLFLGIDNVDEYLQNVAIKSNFNNQEIDEAIISLLGAFRFVLDSLTNVCVIFSLTPSYYYKMMEKIRGDQTLRRRIIIPNGIDGNHVELGQFNEKESHELVAKYMSRWVKRNNINTKFIDEYKPTWPFENDAIKLAWRASPTPSALIFACNEVLNDKIKQNALSAHRFTISEMDIANFLQKNKSNPLFTDKKKIWDDIEILTTEDKIVSTFSRLQEEKGTSFEQSVLESAFGDFFKDIGYPKEDSESGLIIYSSMYGNKKISVKFVRGNRITKQNVTTLSSELKNSKSNAGLLICIVSKNEKIIFDEGVDDLFKDYSKSINYTTVIGSKILCKKEISNIVNLGYIDKTERDLFVRYVDQKLGFKRYLSSLEFTEVSEITS